MFKFISYTFLTVMTVDLLATSGDITMTWSSPVLTKIKSNDSDVNPFSKPITSDEETWVGSLINIGAMIGPLPYGLLAEKFGRKIALLCIAIPHIISYLTLAFSKTVYLYYFARLLGGIAVGGGYTLLPTYVAEISEDSNRGMHSSTLSIFWSLGNMIPYLIGPFISILWFNIILACIPTTFFVLFLLLAPETPHYLIGKNKGEQAEKSLMILRSGNKKTVENEIAKIRADLEHQEEKGSFLDLFRSKVYIKGLVITIVLMMVNQLSGINAVLFYTEDIFRDAGANGLKPEISSIIAGVVIFFSSFVTPPLADRLGRKPLLLASGLGTTLALIAFGIFFFLKDSTDVDVGPLSWLPLLSLVVYLFSFTLAIGPLPWTVSSELFPTCVKSYTASIASFTCWTTSFFVTKFFNDLIVGLGEGGTFWLFAGCCLFGFMFTLIFIPETKGKSFKEIQDILDK